MKNKETVRLHRLRAKHNMLKTYCSNEASVLALEYDLRQAKKVKEQELIDYLKQQLKEVK